MYVVGIPLADRPVITEEEAMHTTLRIDSSTQAPETPTQLVDGLHRRIRRLRALCGTWWRWSGLHSEGLTAARPRARRGGSRSDSPRSSGQRGLAHPVEPMADQLYRAGLHHVR